MASMLMSQITKTVLGACCNDGGLFNKFTDSGAKPEEEKKEDNWDPQFKRNFLNQDMKFELTEWKKLPIKARKAAEALGYTEENWNEDGDGVDVDWEHWWDLTEDQKKNLEILGWDETAWESKYEHTAWKDLPKKQQKAATIAGYTEESWEHGGWLSNLEKSWDDLSKKDREAMCVLGWTKRKWDE